MHNKTVIVILLIAAALVGFIYFFERDTMSTSEKQERKNRVFTAYNRDKIDSLTLKHIAGSEIVLEKKASVENPDGRWFILKPKAMDAEQTEVESMLSALDFLLIDRAVKADNNIKATRFGLDAPRIQGSFSIMGKTTSFEIGADAEGEKVYFHTDTSKDDIYAVNAEILTSLDKSVNDLRTKKLVDMKLSEATHISVNRTIGDIALSKKEDTWQVQVGDKKILAAIDQVQELIGAVGDLRAEKFIADDVKAEGLSPYGLASPTVEVRVTLENDKTIAVKIGAPCKDATHLRYAFVEGSGTVTCVKDDLSATAERPLLRFEETRLSTLQIEDIQKISLTRGDHSIAFERHEAEWILPGNQTAVDAETVNRLAAALTEPRVKQIDTDATVLSALAKPEGTVTLTAMDDKKTVIEIYDIEQELLKCRRAGEAAVLRVPADLDAQLTTEPLRYRQKAIRVGEAAHIDRIEITGAPSQSLEKKDGIWQLTAPIFAPADMTAVRKIEDLVAQVNVERFVAPAAEKTHGFAAPFAVIKTHFSAAETEGDGEGTDKAPDEKEKTVILEIGAFDTEGLRYARLRGSDETVFLVNDSYEYGIRSPLVARDLLQIDDTTLQQLTFNVEGKETVFTKISDVEWKCESDAALDMEVLKKIISDLGGTKAVGAASFGPAPFASALLVITANGKGDNAASQTVVIGPKSADAAENAYLARTDELNVNFLFPARVVDDILNFLAKTEGPLTGTN